MPHPFYIVCYCKSLVKTSWTDSMHILFRIKTGQNILGHRVTIVLNISKFKFKRRARAMWNFSALFSRAKGLMSTLSGRDVNMLWVYKVLIQPIEPPFGRNRVLPFIKKIFWQTLLHIPLLYLNFCCGWLFEEKKINVTSPLPPHLF